MKAVYGIIWLAGDPGNVGRPRSSETQNTKFNPQYLIDWQEGLRAELATPLDSKNNRITIAFDVNRGFDTIQAAEKFCFLHEIDLRAQRDPANPRVGLTATLTLESGGQLFIPTALVTMSVIGYIGLSTDIHYEIFSGAVQGTNPARGKQ